MVHKSSRSQFVAMLLAVSFGAVGTSAYSRGQDVLQVDCECQPVVDNCSCGKWTCPCCQSQAFCPPTGAQPNVVPSPSVDGHVSPDSSIAPASPSPSDSAAPSINLDNGMFGQVPGADDSIVAPTPNVGPQASASDLRNMLALNTAAGASLGGSGSSSRLGGETPEFMGDFLGPEAVNYFIDDYSTAVARSPVALPGARLGRQKLIENNSPIPQDRVFMNYSRFSNVPLTPDGIEIDRFTPGFEKTFLQGLASVELRTPFGTSSSTETRLGQAPDDGDGQFGNLFVGVKAILLGRNDWVVTGGMSVVAPTAESSTLSDGQQVIARIDNGSVHLMPFLGGAIRHNSRHFSQWMVQVDIDATGNDVFGQDQTGTTLVRTGTLQQQNLIYVDLNHGIWLMRAPSTQRYGLTGVAWLNELHINRSLNAGDQVGQFSASVGSFENINVLTGFTAELNRASRLGVGYALPLGNGSDNPFSNELRLTFNRYF